VNANLSPVVAGRLEFDNAINKRIEGIILADTYIIARFNARAPLANQYRPGINLLSSKSLHSQPLGLTIPTVSGRAASLFMRHFQSPLFCVGEPS